MSLIFDLLRKNFLVYNTCWEDPQNDRQLLELNDESRIVMISSAGDNALCYLLDHPKSIHCVDINPRQNALLELKKLCFKELHFDELFQLFGKGCYTPALKHKLNQHLRFLDEPYRSYWEKHLHLFSPSGRGSFYFRGTTGWFAWIMNTYIDHKKLRDEVEQLLSAGSLNEQKDMYREIEPVLFSGPFKKLIEHSGITRLLGVPRQQLDLLPGDTLFDFIKQVLEQVFTRIPVKDNYFWSVYLRGRYTKICCPDYLKQHYFEVIKEQVCNIESHDQSLSQFLYTHSEPCTHFVLLDHMDWYRQGNWKMLDKLWRQILEKSDPGSKFLFRSAGTSCTFLPEFAMKKLCFEHQKTKRLHQNDRVGTYGTTCLGFLNHA